MLPGEATSPTSVLQGACICIMQDLVRSQVNRQEQGLPHHGEKREATQHKKKKERDSIKCKKWLLGGEGYHCKGIPGKQSLELEVRTDFFSH